MPGILRIRGVIELEQFWPNGESDADTTKIKVSVGKDSFAFAPDGKNFKKTNVFFDAFAKGTGVKKVVSEKDNEKRITVRLQGIDAPELHYKAAALRTSNAVSKTQRKKFNEENYQNRRQYQAETATCALAKKLSAYGKPVKCEAVSFVDKPFEVIDTYGRFVANIRVGANYGTDVNLWLSEEGWAYPTFYSSMEAEEIQAYLDTLKAAKSKGRIWKHYSKDASKFDPKLIYRPHGPVDEKNDKGDILMPKLFRRQLSYRMQKKVKVFSGTFQDYLKANSDSCFGLQDFLKNGVHSSEPRRLDQFMNGNKFAIEPQEIVFKEKPSTMVDENDKKIEKFW